MNAKKSEIPAPMSTRRRVLNWTNRRQRVESGAECRLANELLGAILVGWFPRNFSYHIRARWFVSIRHAGVLIEEMLLLRDTVSGKRSSMAVLVLRLDSISGSYYLSCASSLAFSRLSVCFCPIVDALLCSCGIELLQPAKCYFQFSLTCPVSLRRVLLPCLPPLALWLSGSHT